MIEITDRTIRGVAAFMYTSIESADLSGYTDEEYEEWQMRPFSVDGYLERSERFLETLDWLLAQLESEEDESQYMYHFFEAAKAAYDGDKKMIREYFQWLYFLVLGFPNGPRWGDFVQIYGVENFTELLQARIEDVSYPLGREEYVD